MGAAAAMKARPVSSLRLRLTAAKLGVGLPVTASASLPNNSLSCCAKLLRGLGLPVGAP
jgi:hypothetical protein